MNIRYTEKAVKEVEIAFQWYNQQKKSSAMNLLIVSNHLYAILKSFQKCMRSVIQNLGDVL